MTSKIRGQCLVSLSQIALLYCSARHEHVTIKINFHNSACDCKKKKKLIYFRESSCCNHWNAWIAHNEDMHLHIMKHTPATVRVSWPQAGATGCVLLTALHWHTGDLEVKHAHTNLVNIAHKYCVHHLQTASTTWAQCVQDLPEVLCVEHKIKGTSPLWLSEINSSGGATYNSTLLQWKAS